MKHLCSFVFILAAWAWSPSVLAQEVESSPDSVQALDAEVIRAYEKLNRAAQASGLKSAAVTNAVSDVRALELRIDKAMKSWPSKGTAKTCASAEDRALSFSEASAFLSVHFRRFGGSLHTEVADLKNTPQCAGDVVMNRMVPDYFGAIFRNDLPRAAIILQGIDQQYQCMSVRQVRQAAFALRAALEYTRLSFAKSGACAAEGTKALDEAALNLVYRAFERSLPYGRVSLNWLSKRKDMFLAAMRDPNSVTSRMRLWVGSRGLPERIVQIPSQCPAGGAARFAGSAGERSCDGLAAFIRSLDATSFGLGDCFGGDLEPVQVAAGGPAQKLMCRNSCPSLSAIGYPGRAGSLERLPSPHTVALSKSMSRTGRTPLGGSPADTSATCGRAAAGGSLLGGTGSSSVSDVATCMLESRATDNANRSLVSCMAQGLTGNPHTGPAPNLRLCGPSAADGADGKHPPDIDPSRAGWPATPPTEEEQAEASVEAQLRADLDAALDGQDVPDATMMERLSEVARNLPEVKIDFSNPSVMVVTPPIPFGNPGSCGDDSSCPSNCTGGDIFTQTFQTCSERMRSKPKIERRVYARPDPDRAAPTQLGTCFTASVALPPTCPAMNCPGDQTGIPDGAGGCRCGQSSANRNVIDAGRFPKCDLQRCPAGTTPVGPSCACERIGDRTDIIRAPQSTDLPAWDDSLGTTPAIPRNVPKPGWQ